MAYRRNRRESVVSILIYVEGGFQGSTKSACRQAFRIFLERVIPAGSFQVRASGSRSEAFQDFRTALKRHPSDFIILLVDSEESVSAKPWAHLRSRIGDEWVQPTGTSDDQAHLMVQVMESWFLSDRQTLIAYYGQGFRTASLPGQPNIELISKQDVFSALKHASKPTQKGTYHKTKHAFDILEKLDAALVRAASSHVNRLFTVLERETAR